MHVANGVDYVDGQINDFGERLKGLNMFADSEKERIIKIGKRLDECQIQLTPIEELIRVARRTMEEQALFGDDADRGQRVIEKIEVWRLETFRYSKQSRTRAFWIKSLRARIVK